MPTSDFFDWGCRKSDGWLQSAFKTHVKHTWDYFEKTLCFTKVARTNGVGYVLVKMSVKPTF